MVSITFTSPVYLWFLFSLPILIISHSLAIKRTKRNALKFANFEALSKVSKGQFISKNIFLLVFRLIILTFIVLAVSGTTINYLTKGTDSNYVLAIDSSASMLVQDIKPTRFDSAKETLISFLDIIPENTKIGLVSFSGVVLVENPPIENDINKLKNKLKDIKISSVAGTDIGNAIVTSTNLLLSGKDEKSKNIILITDGQSNIGIPLQDALAYANKNNIIINTIGIGTSVGGEFVGTDVISKLDEESLKQIAQATSGLYFKAESKESLLESFYEIAKLNRKKVSYNMSFSFAFLVLIFLLIEWTLINTKNRVIM